MTDESAMRVVELVFELGGQRASLRIRSDLSVERLKEVYAEIVSAQRDPNWFGELVEVTEVDSP